MAERSRLLSGCPAQKRDPGFKSQPLRQPTLKLRLASQLMLKLFIHRSYKRRWADDKPFKILAYFAVKSKEKATRLERYLKGGSGKAFLNKRIL